MNLSSECQAIEMGMQLERDGRAFYLKAAERTTDPKGRAMFLSLADDEAIHLRVLEEQLAAIQQKGYCEVLPEMEEAEAGWDEELFPRDPVLLEKIVHPEASDIDALIFALQAEHKSYELYRRMAKETQDEKARQMFRWLASAERGHFNQLMLNYESLLQSGHWAN